MTEETKPLLDSVKELAKEGKEKLGNLTNEALDGAKKLVDKSWWEKTKDGAGKLWDGTKELASGAVDAVKGAAKSANDSTGGWLGDNKWLLAGVGAALLAVFGMEGGGFFQTLLTAVAAIGALALGSYLDKDNKQSLFGGYFNEKNPSQTKGLSLQQEQPAPNPPNRTTPETNTVTPTDPAAATTYKTKDKWTLGQGSYPLYIDTDGHGIDGSTKGAAYAMHVRVKVDGKDDGMITHISFADANGKFPPNDDEKTMKNISDKGIQFEMKNGHLDLSSDANKDKIKELRKIQVSSLQQQRNIDDEPKHTSLGSLASPVFANAKKDQIQIIG